MKLKFESGKFATPSLEDVRKALLTGLKENYEQVNIEVVDCPNLKDWGCPVSYTHLTLPTIREV